MNICAIVITAFKAEKYILETLSSLSSQVLPKNWTKKFYLGVDACEITSNLLKEKQINYFYSEQNVGTYILTNSLLKIAYKDNCDIFLRFDADDVACEDFLINGILNVNSHGFSRTYFYAADETGKQTSSTLTRAHGPVFFNREVLENLGGYYEFRSGCDTDFNNRANLLGYGTKNDHKPTFLYRQHQNSLMHDKELGKGTYIRRTNWKLMKEKLNQGIIKIDNPVTTDLKFIN